MECLFVVIFLFCLKGGVSMRQREAKLENLHNCEVLVSAWRDLLSLSLPQAPPM